MVGNDPGKDSARVTLTTPTATDNSGKQPRITSNAGSVVKEFKIQAKVHTVKFTASDDSGNSASCFHHIMVKGKHKFR